jgi:transcriptional regulator NrdR family protein
MDMECILCNGATKITNSRPQRRLNRVWRRHCCTVCGCIFTSSESFDESKMWVVKHKNGLIDPFIREDLFLSVYNSCKHRPSAITDAKNLTDTVIGKLLKLNLGTEISVKDLGRVAHNVLLHFDKVAAIYYEAYYLL